MSEAPRHILVIGIGAGDPDHLTLAAVKAMRRADVFFVLGKGAEKDALTGLRRDILDEHLTGPYRVVEADDPWRDRTQRDGGRYASAVHDWRHRRADICERLIADELAPGEAGAFLVWGDPSLYDSTLAILDDIRERDTVAFDHEVIPGVSSVSALAARHRTTLNRVGRPVHITPRAAARPGVSRGLRPRRHARRPRDLHPPGGRGLVDPLGRLHRHPGRDPGLRPARRGGGPDRLKLRAEARERHGWIMDTYLLRQGWDGPQGASRPAGSADGSAHGPLG